MKNNKWSQKGLKMDDAALNGAFWAQKNYGVQISSKNKKSFCNRRVSVWNPDSSKEKQNKIISKCMKNKKWSQKWLKIDDVALNSAFWTQKKSRVQIS